jgi:hypothetical protein
MAQPSMGKLLLRETLSTFTGVNSRAKHVISQPPVNPRKVFFLPLHIKCGLMDNFEGYGSTSQWVSLLETETFKNQ